MLLVFRYLLLALGSAVQARRDLALGNIALRHQREVLTQSRRRPPLQPADRHLVMARPVRCHYSAWARLT